MPEPTIVKGSDQMFTVIYEGNGGGQRVGNFVPFTDNGTINKSCIFNDGDGAYIHRTPGSDGNRRTWTWSAWVKRAKTGAGYMFIYSDASANTEDIQFDSSNRLQYYVLVGGGYQINYISNRTFEDLSKFYHIVVRKDTTQSTAADRVRIYVDGDQITSWNTQTQPSQNDEGFFNQSGKQNAIGNFANVGVSDEAVGYLAEVNFADGQSYGPDTFGLTDTSTGRWIPKSLTGITYGTHGYRMEFANTAGQTIGDDTSGQGNDYTVVNVATTDITTDSPTQNHTTLNQIKNSNITISEGNLRSATVSGAQGYVSGSDIPLTSGKYYGEITITTAGSTLFFVGVGNRNDYLAHYTEENPLSKIEGGYIRSDTGQGYTAFGDTGTYRTYGSSYTTNDIIGIAVDVDKGAVWISKNNTWYNSASASEIENGDVSNSLVTGIKGPLILLNYTHSGTTLDYNFGQKGFEYTPPTGYNAIQQDNFPTTDKGVSDFVWIKNRDATDNHQIYDSSRGVQQMFSLTTTVSQTVTDGLQKFLKGGQQLEGYPESNTNGESYVSWNWHANGGTTSANTDGSGGTVASTIQANQTAGFSIVEFTAPSSGTDPFSVAHGLGKVPKWFMFKRKTGGTSRWLLYHKDAYDASNGGYSMELHAATTNTQFNAEYGTTSIYTSDPTTTTFSLRNNSAVTASADYIAYCWAEIDGYSRFGSYTGNASTNGPFIYTGFKPSWVLVKNRQRATGWYVYDNKRTPFNQMDGHLIASSSAVEGTGSEEMDFLSNGFKCRGDNSGNNRSGEVFIYMAFAEHPFLGDGTNPCTAL